MAMLVYPEVVQEAAWHEGDVVRKLRQAAGWKLRHLHQASGVTIKVLSELELGHTKEAKRGTLTKIAAAFGLSLREFQDLVPSAPVRFELAVKHAEARPVRRTKRG